VQTTIVGIGGGETAELLRDYLVSLTHKPRPRLLYLNTASPQDPARTLSVYEFFSQRAEVDLLQFFPWPPDNLHRFALDHDLVFVGGGNTANMLAVWRVHGFDLILREAFESGIILSGTSAGMICWFEAGVTDSFGPQLSGMRDGLSFLPGSACPHYDDDDLRRPTYRRLIDDESFPPGFAADAGVGLTFIDGELAEVVTQREGATAHRVEVGSETALKSRLLT
jgi:dipeptidase E